MLARQREADAAARLRAEEDRRSAGRRSPRDSTREGGCASNVERAERGSGAFGGRSERLAAERARADLERRSEADAARAAAQAQADRGGRCEAARRTECCRRVGRATGREQAERDRDAVREQLRQQLNVILETRETARGLIINLSDVLFDVDKATLKPGAREKLARISGILSAHPDLKIEIEGHADSTGSEELQPAAVRKSC